MLVTYIKQNCPNAWKEFSEMARKVLDTPSTTSLNLEELPFDLVFGLFLRFFKENELEFDYNNLERDRYEEEIEGIFTSFESVISHYS